LNKLLTVGPEEGNWKHCFIDKPSLQVLLGFNEVVDEFPHPGVTQITPVLWWQESDCNFRGDCAVMKGMELCRLIICSFRYEDYYLTLINSARNSGSELLGNI
jgi:hypothetical protein